MKYLPFTKMFFTILFRLVEKSKIYTFKKSATTDFRFDSRLAKTIAVEKLLMKAL